MGQAFTGMERFLWETFLRCIFLGLSKTLLPIVGALNMLLVKISGLGIQNPVKSAKEKYNSLLRASGNLISAVKGNHIFQLRITSR